MYKYFHLKSSPSRKENIKGNNYNYNFMKLLYLGFFKIIS
jgi:hypothetical protein